jgi:dephospho-CoA kinase
VVIGLTGPIGCGKSTVAGWLAGMGATVVDADEIARVVTAPGQPAHDAVLARFGDPVRADDGTLDRAALARIVFADQAALADLEAIVHPAVRPAILAAIGDARAARSPAIVVEAIKLVESGLSGICDEVWLVTCDPGVQRGRMVGRGSDPADADRRIVAQGDLATRLRPVATRVLDTSGPETTARDLVDAAVADLGVLGRGSAPVRSGRGGRAR